MSREVVLARPHPFIRKPMTELLTKLGFTPVTGSSSADVLTMVKQTWTGVPSEGQKADILIVRPDDLKAPQSERVIQGFFR